MPIPFPTTHDNPLFQIYRDYTLTGAIPSKIRLAFVALVNAVKTIAYGVFQALKSQALTFGLYHDDENWTQAGEYADLTRLSVKALFDFQPAMEYLVKGLVENGWSKERLSEAEALAILKRYGVNLGPGTKECIENRGYEVGSIQDLLQAYRDELNEKPRPSVPPAEFIKLVEILKGLKKDEKGNYSKESILYVLEEETARYDEACSRVPRSTRPFNGYVYFPGPILETCLNTLLADTTMEWLEGWADKEAAVNAIIHATYNPHLVREENSHLPDGEEYRAQFVALSLSSRNLSFLKEFSQSKYYHTTMGCFGLVHKHAFRKMDERVKNAWETCQDEEVKQEAMKYLVKPCFSNIPKLMEAIENYAKTLPEALKQQFFKIYFMQLYSGQSLMKLSLEVGDFEEYLKNKDVIIQVVQSRPIFFEVGIFPEELQQDSEIIAAAKN